MIIDLSPDYDLFIKILFAYWILVGILRVIAGISQADRPNQDKYGITEVINGGLILMLCVWVIC